MDSVLIIADEVEFSRSVVARWQTERKVPAFTLVSGELWSNAVAADFGMAIVGPMRNGRLETVLAALEPGVATAVYVAPDRGAEHRVRNDFPRILVLKQNDGWLDALMLVAQEALRRAEAADRARRIEQIAIQSQRYATLGRYMLEMRHSFNNALTSVLGNAELLLLEPGALSAATREQIETIHSMALRMHEIIQRFSSLDAEMQFAEKASHPETKAASQAAKAGLKSA
jgi:signal transduction histidine kinase